MIMRTNNCLIVEEEALQIFSAESMREKRGKVFCVLSLLFVCAMLVCVCFYLPLFAVVPVLNFEPPKLCLIIKQAGCEV